MVAGIPGTSISGLYYILLAFMMPVREAQMSWNGRSSVKRWMSVFLQMFNAAGILASIYGTGWALSYVIHKCSMIGLTSGKVPQQVSGLMSLTSACFALAILGVVLVVVLGMSLVLPKRPRRTVPVLPTVA
jgi:hypothetical protein